MKRVDRDFFFDRVRQSLFGGSLSAAQVANMESIIRGFEEEGIEEGVWIAAGLATARIEVGMKMAPVREGFTATDAAARAAVAKLYAKGVITTNYALPHPKTGKSYYGRGYPQLTWYDNYLKAGKALGLDLIHNPDLMLDAKIAARVMAWGMKGGHFRKGHSLPAYFPKGQTPSVSQMFASREIINGDKDKMRGKVKIGTEYAGIMQKFMLAIKMVEDGDVVTIPAPAPVDKPTTPVHTPWYKRLWTFITGAFK